MKTKLKVLLALTSLTCLTAVQGQTVVNATSATSSSNAEVARNLSRTIEGPTPFGFGLTGVGPILDQTHSVNNGSNDGYWLSADTGGNEGAIVLDFTLSEATTVNAVHLWNYERDTDTDRGFASFDISFSTDGVNYGVLPTITISGIAKGVEVEGVVAGPTVVQSFSFAAQSGVTDIRITNIANHGDTGRVGLSEIRFGAIPEPSAFGLIAGFLGFTWVMLRRRRA